MHSAERSSGALFYRLWLALPFSISTDGLFWLPGMCLCGDGILHGIPCGQLWPIGYWRQRQSCGALQNHGGPAESHRNVFPADPGAAELCSAGYICVPETGSGLCGFPCESLVCTAVVVFIVKSQHNLRRAKGLANRFAAPINVY